MLKALQPESPLVRYGTTIATSGRMAASAILMGDESVYAYFALASNVTGLTFSHTKPGVAAECTLMIAGLSALATKAIYEGNGRVLWMAGVGIMAFSNALVNTIRYTKACPKQWRLYEGQENAAVIPEPAYQQKTKTSFTPMNILKGVGKGLQSVATFIPRVAKSFVQDIGWACQNSRNPRMQKFGEDLVTITERKMFPSGMTALVGITPFIADGIARNDTSRIVGGSAIFLANMISSVSIPQKQKHPLLALFYGKNKAKPA